MIRKKTDFVTMEFFAYISEYLFSEDHILIYMGWRRKAQGGRLRVIFYNQGQNGAPISCGTTGIVITQVSSFASETIYS